MDKDNISDTQKDLSTLGEALSSGFQEGMDIDRGDLRVRSTVLQRSLSILRAICSRVSFRRDG